MRYRIFRRPRGRARRCHSRSAWQCSGEIINPGAFTHYAWSIHDALAAFSGPIIEVHISNPNAREPWRHTSVIAPVATGSIMGFACRISTRGGGVVAKLHCS